MMKGWLEEWGPPLGDEHVAMETSTAGRATKSERETDELEASSGSAFNRLFLTIRHHEGAIAMATAGAKSGRFEPARVVAEDMASAQEAEIQEMKVLLGRPVQ